MATEVAIETQQNWIGGKWVPAASGQTFEDRNPADRDEVVGLFPKSDKRDVDAAVAAAKKAFPGWKNTPAPRRAEVLYSAAEILKRDKEKLARLMTREMGKVLTETRGDVQEAIDMAYLAAGEGRRLFGFTTPSELPNKFAMCIRQPVGVCAFVTPWNFPMAIPAWKSMAALIAGNTIVIKPATDTPARSWLSRESSKRRDCRRASSTSSWAPAARSATRSSSTRTSRSCLTRARPRSAGGSRRPARRRSSGCTSRWAARTRSSSWTTRTWTSRSTAPCGAPSGRPVSAARRLRGSSCTRPSTRSSSRSSPRGRRRSAWATASIRTWTWGPAFRRSSARRSRSTSRSARTKARGS